MKRHLVQILMDCRGTSAVEYGIICALIIIGLVSAISGVADETASTWNEVSSKSQEAIGTAR